MLVTVNNGNNANSSTNKAINRSDFVLVLIPEFTHGRAGTVSVNGGNGGWGAKDSAGISGISAGLRKRTLGLVQGRVVRPSNESGLLPQNYLGISLEGSSTSESVILSTDESLSAADITSKTASYRSKEAATLTKYGDEWAPVKDALQTVLMWSFVYDNKEGLVAPVFMDGAFSSTSVDGDEKNGLFCWDGSFASYMLSLDALDLAFSNLIQIIKARTAAGFIASLNSGTFKSRDRSNPPVTAKILHEITKRWGTNRTKWVVELCFEDLLEWNTWMYTQRRELPLGMLAWGSNPYVYAPDGMASDRGGGRGGANLESGLDNAVVTGSAPFNATGRYVQDEYDAGYTGMFLMDCQAQIALANMVGREDAAQVLQSRFDEVNKAMMARGGAGLWNESAGYFMNKKSSLEAGQMEAVQRMAPTNFYPLLVGPEFGPTEEQATTMIQRHLTNASRFGVWPSAEEPSGNAVPPKETRPLVQWYSHKCSRGFPCKDPVMPHRLCCQSKCSFNQSTQAPGGGYIQRLHGKIRYEGLGLASIPNGDSGAGLVPLFTYTCPVSNTNATDYSLGPAKWNPATGPACRLLDGDEAAAPELYVYKTPPAAGPMHLVALELWYKPGDHYVVASDAGKAEAKADGYIKLETFGFVWPAPGTTNASSSRYPLPAISKDDPSYKDQDYWHGRIWSPMIQLCYWGLEQYRSETAKGATAGLVAQSRALLMKEWLGSGSSDLSDPNPWGRLVFENYGADTGNGWEASSSATPLYSWGALAGFIGLQANGFYEPLQ
jgi:hypothetical protein